MYKHHVCGAHFGKIKCIDKFPEVHSEYEGMEMIVNSNTGAKCLT